jgi:hypothetical protein
MNSRPQLDLFINFNILTTMAYASPSPQIVWDRPGLFQGVTIRRLIEGEWYAWKIPYNGLVSQARTADLLGVSVTAVNDWVHARKVRHIKIAGQPSAIPLAEVKRIKKLLTPRGRLGT